MVRAEAYVIQDSLHLFLEPISYRYCILCEEKTRLPPPIFTFYTLFKVIDPRAIATYSNLLELTSSSFLCLSFCSNLTCFRSRRI